MKNFRSTKYLVTFWMLMLSTTLLLGQEKSIPGGYYDGTETLTGAPLKTVLYNIIKGHTIIGYSGLWNAYKTTDKLVIGSTTYVYDMYSVKSDSTATYYYTLTTDQCGNYSGEGDCYNREHSFPKSWFNDASPMYSDLFHIVPTDGYVNGKRSNYPFGEVGAPTWTSTNGSKLGSSNYAGYTGTVFEPIDEYKGDFARTYFYMATRYENIIAGWETYDSNGDAMLDGLSFPCFEPWALKMLIEWHNEDPISTKELNRNEAVYALQHNRNPFIDHPEFVYKIWGGNSPSIIADIVTQPTVPKNTDVVTVSAAITDAEGIDTVVLKWGTNSGSLSNSIAMITSGSNSYSTQTAIPTQINNITVFYIIEVTDTQTSVTSSSTNSYTVLPSDVTAPILTMTPPTNTTEVELNATININSNEPLLTKTGQTIDETYLKTVIDLKLYDVNGANLSFNAGISNNNQLITIWPLESFTNDITYFAKLNSKAFADIAGNLTDSLQTSFTTISFNDTIAPQFIVGFPKTDSITSQSFNLLVSMDEPGRIYYQLKLKTELAPTNQELLESASLELLEGFSPDTIFFEELTENTTYSVYLLTQDQQPIPNTSLFALKQNVTTLGVAPIILAEPKNQMICKGNEVLFSSSASGTDPLAYQWYFGETLLQNAIDDTLKIPSTTESHAGFYKCKISNTWGFVFSQDAELDFIADVFGGTDNQVSVKNTVLELDLFELLLNNPEPGGEWIDLDYSQALNGSIFSPYRADAGIYRFNYIVTNQCTTDTATVTVTVESPDAIHRSGLEGLIVYPNPSNGIFYIQIPNSLTNHSLHIFSPQGTLLKQIQTEKLSEKITFDLSELGKGIYYIKISADSKVIVKKLVIN